MKSNRGFTLIEILIVIVVIAGLVSITALNNDGDPRADTLKINAQGLLFYLDEATDEAILNNKSIAIYFTKYSATPYSWQKIEEEVDVNAPNNQPQTNPPEKWNWSEYQSRKLIPVEFDTESEIKLFVNDAESPLTFQKSNDNTVVPQLIIQASGIQSIIKFEVGLADYEKTISVIGNGAGRFKLGQLSKSKEL
ncbi:MAG: prepilin-type N-terminal cleavage/methylation domain-containing protein [Bermanella sp.]|jgi:prepilin-type N-terminal cleavage/methylation domain-containing protein